MHEKMNMLNTGDKDLLCEYLYLSVGRVINKNVTTWNRPVPQGCSVYMAHPDTGVFEYMFTKDDKFCVVKDNPEEVYRCLCAYGNINAGGIILYLNKCMLAIASKHKRYSY